MSSAVIYLIGLLPELVRLYRKKTIIKGRGRYAGKRPHSACIEDGSLGPFGPVSCGI
ncbi:hypothetical protein CLOSYM_00770 [[Clostridium] symbiosum ATCC 14940]|uniref:Uncharacterized protein n=1 Tax=[Clostridium] symbiosum ATCC 14940 TaxID=411472 RepID=A0ABC9U267_CLOSY|nr:hypothetical protein CLOSYM_00770 [[Clostridium] symbiosum ATCC 14940]